MDKVVILARVSTDKQEYQRQVNELTDYCTRVGWSVEAVFSNKVSGAKRMEERTKMKADLESMEAKMKKLQDKWFDGIIDDDSFTAMNSRLVAEKKDLELRLAESNEQPLDKQVADKMRFSLSFIENMGSCVATAPIHLKLDILGSIFSGKIILENSEPRTATLSPLVSLIVGKSKTCNPTKTKQPSDSSESCSRGAMWGSNPRHPEPQSGALPTELIAPC